MVRPGNDRSRGIVAWSNSATPVKRTTGLPETSRRPRPRPTHQGSGLPIDDSVPLRDECWAALPENLRSRVTEAAGNSIAWFASTDPASGDGRSRAVVLGTRALAIAEPRINADGRPVYALSRYEFLPGSHRAVPIQHRPQPHRSSARPPARQAGESPAPNLGLSTQDQGQLGNLPPQAQELLQAPFSASEPVQRCEYYYSGFANRLDTYVLILAGRRFVTAATGTQQVPVGSTAADAHWDLVCHRLAVARRVGS